MKNTPHTTNQTDKKKWLSRIVLALGCIMLPGLLLVGWYLSPLLTAQQGSALSAFTLDAESPSDNHPLFNMHHGALRWFYSTKPIKETQRILVLGFDQINGRRRGRTDTMMVVEVNPRKGVGIISVPRDLWVPIPNAVSRDGNTLTPKLTNKELERRARGPEFGRINTIYRLGNRRYGKGIGHRLLKEVLETALDFKIDFTVAVNYSGFERIIETLGGVHVDVQCPIQDNFINTDLPSGYESLDIPSGKQKLTARQTLLFMRSRHGRTDMDRSRRQQRVLLGLRDDIFARDMFWKLPTIASKLLPYVKMDMELSTLLRLAVTVKQLNQRLHGMVLRPPIVEEMRTEENQRVLVLSNEKYQQKKATLYQAALPGDKGSRVCPAADVALHWREKKNSANDTAAGVTPAAR